MLNYLNLNNWSSLENRLEQKPNIMLTQFSIIAIIAALIQVANDLYHLNYVAIGLDAIILILFVVTYLLNENRKHLLAKFSFVVVGTSFIFIYAAIIPKTNGVYLIFFPIIAIIFLIFSNEERHYKYYSLAFVLGLLLILETTNYQPFGILNITEGKSETSSFYVNMAISFFVLVYSMYNMEAINRKVDRVRLDTLKELEEKNKELELTNNELDHFVYSASHDLKAPLSSILGLINIAKYEVKEQHAIGYFVRIEDRVARLTKFIKEVIEISRNTRTEITPEAVNTHQLIDDLIENNSYIDDVHQTEFRKSVDCDDIVWIDRARLEVILNNLISNAIKYKDAGKNQHWVSIDCQMSRKKLKVHIEDNGIGIPLEQQQKVFEMFYRGTQGKEGSGLGLYIVKNMVDKLEGSFVLQSEVKKGTSIKLEFPIKAKKPQKVDC